jgi:NAD(P)H dehydrogenase (quinone)
MKKIIVLGAPADQGIPLLTALKARGLEPTAGVRRPGAMAATPHPDVPEVAADLYDVASLTAAFSGQDAVAMHLPFEFDRARAATMGRNIAEAARLAGLQKIVFNTSCFVADHDLGLSAHDGRRDIERAIHDSGVPYVIIEPMVFMDNITRIWSRPAIVNSGVFAYPAAATLKISWVCLEDVAGLYGLGAAPRGSGRRPHRGRRSRGAGRRRSRRAAERRGGSPGAVPEPVAPTNLRRG